LVADVLLSSTVDILKKTTVDKLPNDLEGMEASMERLHALIEDVYKYVDGVVVIFFPVSFCYIRLVIIFVTLTATAF